MTTARATKQSSTTPETPVKKARLFTNGRSQAVRLPKEFRFEGSEVEIRRNPATGEVILSELHPVKGNRWQYWFDRFDALEIPDDIFERKTSMPVERDIFK